MLTTKTFIIKLRCMVYIKNLIQNIFINNTLLFIHKKRPLFRVAFSILRRSSLHQRVNLLQFYRCYLRYIYHSHNIRSSLHQGELHIEHLLDKFA